MFRNDSLGGFDCRRLSAWYAVRTRHDVTAINRARRTIAIGDLATGGAREEPYDALVLARGPR